MCPSAWLETKHIMVLSSQSRGAAENKTTSEDVSSDDEASDDWALEIRKSYSDITRHLKESAEYRDKVYANLLKCFTILAKARNASHLGVLEAIFIARRSPVLCSQKEFVRSLALFACLCLLLYFLILFSVQCGCKKNLVFHLISAIWSVSLWFSYVKVLAGVCTEMAPE